MTMTQVSVAEVKQHLADLLGRVAYGKEQVTITRRGKPMAVLVPLDQAKPRRHLAEAKGWLSEGDEFFVTMKRIVNDRSKHLPRHKPS